MDKNHSYAKILYLTYTEEQEEMQLYGQTTIIPLDGEKIKPEEVELYKALTKKLTYEEYTHQNNLAKVGYKIFEAGSKTFVRIDVILQNVPVKMK